MAARVGRSWPRGWALVLGLLAACAVGGLAQPPEEEEDPKGGLKKRVTVEDDPLVKPKAGEAGPGTPPDARLDELVRGADEVTHPAIKELLQKHIYPFDRITTKTGSARVKPIPLSRAERLPAQFGVQEIGRDGRLDEPVGVNAADVRKVEYFEEIALAEANAVLAFKPFGTTANGPQGWTATDQLAAAEKLLGAALRFHDYAREHNIRRGRGWDDVRKPLADRLRWTREQSLENAVGLSDWARVREISTRLMLAYPKDAAVAAKVASARVQEAKRLLATDKHFDHVKARELLDEFEANYPGGGGEPVKVIRAKLAEIAFSWFQRAKDKKGVNDLTAARDALTKAVALDPTVPGVREMQRELKTGYQTLYVGVRQYPELMSPLTAKLDSEKQAVELVFEGLLAAVPDDGGGARYRPATATAMPAVLSGAREFSLRTFDLDASGRFGFEARDVVNTVRLLGTRTDTWAAYPLWWLDDLPNPKDNTTVKLSFRQGHPDPRALLTFKLYPAEWMREKNVRIDDRGFGEAPLGTGPYRLHSSPKPEGAAPREMVFVDNPLYGRWRDRANQPHIKEIRLLEVSKVHNIVEAFKQGGLHILPDVPTGDLDKYRTALGTAATDYTALNNRRVHLLAVNQRERIFHNKALRQGLMRAIDREAILNDVFRAGKPEFHRALTGPFPPQCWATAKGASGTAPALVNRDLAFERLRSYLFDAAAKAEIELAYPNDDPQVKLACEKIKAQVEGLFKEGGTGRKLTIKLDGMPTRELLRRVHDEHRYELAYVPFDYPDDWYPFALGAMLDPLAASRGGRNFSGFLSKEAASDADDTRLGRLLDELRAYRAFDTLGTKTAEVQKLFNECVPFVPLWQLDRHTIVSGNVQIYTDDSDTPANPRVLDPTTLFQGIAYWRMK